MFLKQTQLFFDPKLNYPLDDLTLSFAEYISQCEALIEKTRIDLLPANRSQIIAANAPFEFRPIDQPIRYGALLTHGLYDSPFQMRDIGLHLQKTGGLVRSLLLPGHGTVPGALLNVTYEDWLKTLHYGVTKMLEETDRVILIGNSTGAALSLYYALQNSEKIAGIILISPALKIYSKLAFIARLPLFLSPFFPKAAWLYQDPHETMDYAKYRSFTFNSVYQVYRLTMSLQKIQKQVTCPLFFVQSLDDNVVSPTAVLNYFANNPCPQNKLILYSTQKEILADPRIINRQSHYPTLNIKNFSHIALPIAPSNSHYGEKGDYPLASHIDPKNNQIIYGEFNEKLIKYQTRLFNRHLIATRFQRLTFNPDFDFLIRSLIQFIDSI